jgi:hypothetical protein
MLQKCAKTTNLDWSEDPDESAPKISILDPHRRKKLTCKN